MPLVRGEMVAPPNSRYGGLRQRRGMGWEGSLWPLCGFDFLLPRCARGASAAGCELRVEVCEV